MVLMFYLGWVLLLAAFASGAAEAVVHAHPGWGGILTSAHDLWYTLWPGSLVVTQIRIEKVMPALWDPIILTVLALPAWVLFGASGASLVWLYRPGRFLTQAERDEFRKHEEAVFFFDELNREALSRTEDDSSDDTASDYDGPLAPGKWNISGDDGQGTAF